MQKQKIPRPVIIIYGRASPLPDFCFFFRRFFALAVPLYCHAIPESLNLITSMNVFNKDENAGRLTPVKFEDAVKRIQTM